MEKHSEITLPGGGTTVLHGTRAAGDDAPVALLLPAMGVPAGYYGPFVDELARAGVSAAVADYPGQGESRPRSGRGRDLGYDALAHAWLPAVVHELRREHPGPVVAIGHSLGGHVLAAHLSADEADVDAVVLIGSGTPYWRDQQGIKTLVQTQFIGLVSRALGYWPGTRFGFGGTQSKTLMVEWAAFGRTGRLAPGGRDIAPGLAHRDLPLLVVDLDNDTLAPPSAVDGLVAMFAGADVDRCAFAKQPDDLGKPVDHYSFARSPEIIGERIATWALDRVSERRPSA
ncbi:alpha/beta hydrolase family protein [Janibacter indicus]|uniref:Predicted alpha/beta hydrolase n=1 Tax=Janibacter indicus TaxID=857417 RepID=A0A1W2CFF9_9MICO|nr:alpha/beta fold hydrolase [Janibacter indicus]SMC83953.1 Predicted alpha/beta hydrolase [Janibacter indicus]